MYSITPIFSTLGFLGTADGVQQENLKCRLLECVAEYQGLISIPIGLVWRLPLNAFIAMNPKLWIISL